MNEMGVISPMQNYELRIVRYLWYQAYYKMSV